MKWQAPRMHRTIEDRVAGYQVLGERSSGTNFVDQLLRNNLRGVAQTPVYGWKHGFIDRREAARAGVLTVVVYRHPLRWLQSIAARPLHLSRAMQGLPFDRFIRHEWQGAFARPDGTEEPSAADMDPDTGAQFANPIRARTAKMRWLEEMAEMPARLVYLRFEDVNRDPRATLAAIAETFEIRLRPYAPIDTFKGNPTGRYVPKAAPRIATADLEFVAQELDLTYERRIGYRLEEVPRFDGLRGWDMRSLRSRVRAVRSRWGGTGPRGRG